MRLSILLAVFLACATAHADLKVVATLPSLAALAKAIGGDAVTVDALAAPTEDPHYVDPRPSLIVKLNRADLLITNGLELEVGWLPPIVVAARNSTIQAGARGHLEASTAVDKLDVSAGRIDRSMGDVHPGGNPHFLYDPRAAARIATTLGKRLAELDPAHASSFQNNAATLAEALNSLATAQAQRFRALPSDKRKVVSYHRSFSYLYDWLGLEEVTTLEPRPGISPDPGHVAKVLSLMRQAHVHVIVQEEFQPQNTSKTAAELAGGRVVVLPGGARFLQGESYAAHIEKVAEVLYDALTH